MKKTVAVCEMQPIAAEGLRALLSSSTDLELLWVVPALSQIADLLSAPSPCVIVLDKAFGSEGVLNALVDIRTTSPGTAAIVWGISITESEALCFMQAGARGIV